MATSASDLTPDLIHARRSAESPGTAKCRFMPSWEDALTLALTAAAFLTVAANVQNAHWVDGLPSLYPIGITAVLAAYGLSRVRINQILLVPAGLFVGATIVYFQLIAIVPGASVYVRTAGLVGRMHPWWAAVTGHGRSIDPLPVIVIMVAATWIGSFLGAWAIFRWRNAVLGLAPGTAALIWDAGFSTGELSITSVVYLVLGVLLFMRMRVLRQQTRWERASVPYPRFISLSALNVTLWATLALLASASVVPIGSQSAAASARWDRFTGPFTNHLTPLARAFLSINPDKGAKIHALKDALVLQGLITPKDVPAASVNVSLPADVAPFLRDQSFEQYRRDGWQVNSQGEEPLAPGSSTDVVTGGDGISPLMRQPVTVEVKVAGGNGDRLLSVGQPLQSDRSASSKIGANSADVSSIQPGDHLSNGTKYSVVGSVSAATEDQLRGAGTAYPSWVTQSYLQLSRRVPPRVGDKAKEIVAATNNPYDAASAIEAFLRTFPIDYSVSAAPNGQDPVDYFLFDAQRGYFDYHASAMTVMLRTLGIPARLASGFVLDPSQRQGDSNTFKLTQQQAFAWPEVYFPTVGWVEFNPTPSQPEITRPAMPQTEIPPQPTLPVSSSEDGSRAGINVHSLPNIGGAVAAMSWTGWRNLLLAMLAAVASAAAIGVLAFWEFGVRGMGLRERLWENSIRLATLGDAPPHPHETPRAYAARLARAVPEASAVVGIAESYERARFGNKVMTRDEGRRLRAAWSATRRALVRRMLRLTRHSSGDGRDQQSVDT